MREFAENLEIGRTLEKKLSGNDKGMRVLGHDGGLQISILLSAGGRIWSTTTKGLHGLDTTYHNVEAARKGDSGDPHYPGNVGGVERVWFTSEVGQCFAPSAKTIPENWYAKRIFDFAKFKVQSVNDHATPTAITIETIDPLKWTNYYGRELSVSIERYIRLVNNPMNWGELEQHFESGELRHLCYFSKTSVTNQGEEDISIDNKNLIAPWILAQFNPMGKTCWIAPEKKSPIYQLGPQFVDYNFGIDKAPMAEDRRFARDDYFIKPVDGMTREKWGIPLNRFGNKVGYLDLAAGELFIMKYETPTGNQTRILEQSWTKAPRNAKEYASKVFNPTRPVVDGYNDGPMQIGKPPMGGFFEVELLGNAQDTYVHQRMGINYTAHRIQGPGELLLKVANHMLMFGIDLSEEKLLK